MPTNPKAPLLCLMRFHFLSAASFMVVSLFNGFLFILFAFSNMHTKCILSIKMCLLVLMFFGLPIDRQQQTHWVGCVLVDPDLGCHTSIFIKTLCSVCMHCTHNAFHLNVNLRELQCLENGFDFNANHIISHKYSQQRNIVTRVLLPLNLRAHAIISTTTATTGYQSFECDFLRVCITNQQIHRTRRQKKSYSLRKAWPMVIQMRLFKSHVFHVICL